MNKKREHGRNYNPILYKYILLPQTYEFYYLIVIIIRYIMLLYYLLWYVLITKYFIYHIKFKR